MSDCFYWLKAIALIFLASSLLGAILHQKAYANQTTDAKNCKHALNAIQRGAHNTCTDSLWSELVEAARFLCLQLEDFNDN